MLNQNPVAFSSTIFMFNRPLHSKKAYRHRKNSVFPNKINQSVLWKVYLKAMHY